MSRGRFRPKSDARHSLGLRSTLVEETFRAGDVLPRLLQRAVEVREDARAAHVRDLGAVGAVVVVEDLERSRPIGNGGVRRSRAQRGRPLDQVRRVAADVVDGEGDIVDEDAKEEDGMWARTKGDPT